MDGVKIKEKRLIIHIGSPRAASTAIQKSLQSNGEFLHDNGVYYGDYMYISYCDAHTHHNLLWAIADETYTLLGIPPLYKIPESAETIADRMIDGAEKSSCETILLSCELFFYTIFDTHLKLKGISVADDQIAKAFRYSVNRFQSLFDGFEVKVICYLRRQDLFVESWFNQFAKESSPDFFKTINGGNDHLLYHPEYKFKGGSRVPGFTRMFKALFNYTNYYAILNEWATSYGKENIIVRPLEKKQLDGSVSKDFFKNALCIELMGSKEDIVVNTRVNRDSLEYLLRLQMRGFHSRISDIPDMAPLRRTDNLYMSLDERNALMSYHKRGNEEIAREFLHRKDGILFLDEVKQEEDTYTGLVENKIFYITRELLK